MSSPNRSNFNPTNHNNTHQHAPHTPYNRNQPHNPQVNQNNNNFSIRPQNVVINSPHQISFSTNPATTMNPPLHHHRPPQRLSFNTTAPPNFINPTTPGQNVTNRSHRTLPTTTNPASTAPLLQRRLQHEQQLERFNQQLHERALADFVPRGGLITIKEKEYLEYQASMIKTPRPKPYKERAQNWRQQHLSDNDHDDDDDNSNNPFFVSPDTQKKYEKVPGSLYKRRLTHSNIYQNGNDNNHHNNMDNSHLNVQHVTENNRGNPQENVFYSNAQIMSSPNDEDCPIPKKDNRYVPPNCCTIDNLNYADIKNLQNKQTAKSNRFQFESESSDNDDYWLQKKRKMKFEHRELQDLEFPLQSEQPLPLQISPQQPPQSHYSQSQNLFGTLPSLSTHAPLSARPRLSSIYRSNRKYIEEAERKKREELEILEREREKTLSREEEESNLFLQNPNPAEREINLAHLQATLVQSDFEEGANPFSVENCEKIVKNKRPRCENVKLDDDMNDEIFEKEDENDVKKKKVESARNIEFYNQFLHQKAKFPQYDRFAKIYTANIINPAEISQQEGLYLPTAQVTFFPQRLSEFISSHTQCTCNLYHITQSVHDINKMGREKLNHLIASNMPEKSEINDENMIKSQLDHDRISESNEKDKTDRNANFSKDANPNEQYCTNACPHNTFYSLPYIPFCLIHPSPSSLTLHKPYKSILDPKKPQGAGKVPKTDDDSLASLYLDQALSLSAPTDIFQPFKHSQETMTSFFNVFESNTYGVEAEKNKNKNHQNLPKIELNPLIGDHLVPLKQNNKKIPDFTTDGTSGSTKAVHKEHITAWPNYTITRKYPIDDEEKLSQLSTQDLDDCVDLLFESFNSFSFQTTSLFQHVPFLPQDPNQPSHLEQIELPHSSRQPTAIPTISYLIRCPHTNHPYYIDIGSIIQYEIELYQKEQFLRYKQSALVNQIKQKHKEEQLLKKAMYSNKQKDKDAALANINSTLASFFLKSEEKSKGDNKKMKINLDGSIELSDEDKKTKKKPRETLSNKIDLYPHWSLIPSPIPRQFVEALKAHQSSQLQHYYYYLNQTRTLPFVHPKVEYFSRGGANSVRYIGGGAYGGIQEELTAGMNHDNINGVEPLKDYVRFFPLNKQYQFDKQYSSHVTYAQHPFTSEFLQKQKLLEQERTNEQNEQKTIADFNYIDQPSFILPHTNSNIYQHYAMQYHLSLHHANDTQKLTSRYHDQKLVFLTLINQYLEFLEQACEDEEIEQMNKLLETQEHQKSEGVKTDQNSLDNKDDSDDKNNDDIGHSKKPKKLTKKQKEITKLEKRQKKKLQQLQKEKEKYQRGTVTLSTLQQPSITTTTVTIPIVLYYLSNSLIALDTTFGPANVSGYRPKNTVDLLQHQANCKRLADIQGIQQTKLEYFIATDTHAPNNALNDPQQTTRYVSDDKTLPDVKSDPYDNHTNYQQMLISKLNTMSNDIENLLLSVSEDDDDVNGDFNVDFETTHNITAKTSQNKQKNSDNFVIAPNKPIVNISKEHQVAFAHFKDKYQTIMQKVNNYTPQNGFFNPDSEYLTQQYIRNILQQPQYIDALSSEMCLSLSTQLQYINMYQSNNADVNLNDTITTSYLNKNDDNKLKKPHNKRYSVPIANKRHYLIHLISILPNICPICCVHVKPLITYQIHRLTSVISLFQLLFTTMQSKQTSFSSSAHSGSNSLAYQFYLQSANTNTTHMLSTPKLSSHNIMRSLLFSAPENVLKSMLSGLSTSTSLQGILLMLFYANKSDPSLRIAQHTTESLKKLQQSRNKGKISPNENEESTNSKIDEAVEQFHVEKRQTISRFDPLKQTQTLLNVLTLQNPFALSRLLSMMKLPALLNSHMYKHMLPADLIATKDEVEKDSASFQKQGNIVIRKLFTLLNRTDQKASISKNIDIRLRKVLKTPKNKCCQEKEENSAQPAPNMGYDNDYIESFMGFQDLFHGQVVIQDDKERETETETENE